MTHTHFLAGESRKTFSTRCTGCFVSIELLREIELDDLALTPYSTDGDLTWLIDSHSVTPLKLYTVDGARSLTDVYPGTAPLS